MTGKHTIRTCECEGLALLLVHADKQCCQLVPVLLLNALPGISNSLRVNTNLRVYIHVLIAGWAGGRDRENEGGRVGGWVSG